ELRYELDGGNHVARVASAVLIEDFQSDDPGLWCHSAVASARQGAVTRDQSGHVSAVTVPIAWRRRLSPVMGEVVEAVDTVAEFRARFETRIDHGDTDPDAAKRRGGE